jgi:glycosyltransferase involved in cell wall biosynthesis
VVVDVETGILIPLEQQDVAPFEPVDPDKFSRDMAAGVNKLINDKELAKVMARKGRKRVEDYFDWIAIAKQVEGLYKSVM